MSYSLASYVKTFLNPKQISHPPPNLGYILFINSHNGPHCLAAGFLYHLLDQSDAPDTLAVEILEALSTVPILKAVVCHIYPKSSRAPLMEKYRWASLMLSMVPMSPPRSIIEGAIPALNRLAAYYLTRLCLVVCDPNISHYLRIPRIFYPSHFEYSSSRECYPIDFSLIELILQRDDRVCLVTGTPVENITRLALSSTYPSATNHVLTRILPRRIIDHELTLQCIEKFTGGRITGDLIRQKIDDPSNAFILREDAQITFLHCNSWGLECILDETGKVQYMFRAISPNAAYYPRLLLSGIDTEILFLPSRDPNIAALSPDFCNLRLKLSRLFHLTNAYATLHSFCMFHVLLSNGVNIKVNYELDQPIPIRLWGRSDNDSGVKNENTDERICRVRQLGASRYLDILFFGMLEIYAGATQMVREAGLDDDDELRKLLY
ncbi:hypothetical protein M422DRAFT_774341 [Sphaerobolus stellatus SS14]|nr:hypothetical protein M422DRAFT_774341 [Sphaerobolus stellatus SS14]